MKIALVCTSGGHLTEMLLLMEAFKAHDVVFLTYNNPSTISQPYKIRKIEYIGVSPIRMIKSFLPIFKFLKKEKPQMVISTGSEIAIPTFLLCKIIGIRTVYIESWCWVNTKSGTGKILYYIADLFLVQWPDLVRVYGKKARYEGSVI
jgi:beta-1,4-N-acetylglucosaminyltransferase